MATALPSMMSGSNRTVALCSFGRAGTRPKACLQATIHRVSHLLSIGSDQRSGLAQGESKISTLSRISASRSNAKARLRIAFVFACAAVLVGWFIYDQAGNGSATSGETTADGRSRGFDARNPAMPVAPPVPYRFAGISSQGDATQYLLAKDDRVFAVKVGAILDGVYRVESTGEREVALRYLPLGLLQTVPLQAAAWPPAGEPAGSSGQPAKPSVLPPAVQRTRSPALLELSR
jgi:hypothetical protein